MYAVDDVYFYTLLTAIEELRGEKGLELNPKTPNRPVNPAESETEAETIREYHIKAAGLS